MLRAPDGAHACRTIAQRRLVALRGGAVALIAAEAALTALPNLAVLRQPCMYRDTRDSVVRWSSVARQSIAFVFLATKCMEVRGPYVVH